MSLRPCVVLVCILLSAPARAQTPVPLADLGNGTWKDWQGGLYPDGVNTPPPAHRALAEAQADLIVPRDAAGSPAPAGWIGMVSLGMSNTSQEFKVLEHLLESDPAVHPAVRVINGAQGGIAAESMADPAHPYWALLESRVLAAGLSPAQVQVCWLKQALGTVSDPSFPAHVQLLESRLESIVLNARARFPNLRLCYLANRIYGGYTDRVDRGEPLSYETGFAVQALIARQISGDPALNPDPAAGPVRAPVLLWGSEQWANGGSPRQDGLTWQLEDYEADRIHPSPAGEWKVGLRWKAALDSDPVAQRWLYRPAVGERRVALIPSADTSVNAAQPGVNFGALTDLRFGWPNTQAETLALLRFVLPAGTPSAARLWLHGFNPVEFQWWAISDRSWQESVVTWQTRPALAAQPLGSSPAWNGDGSVALAIDPGSAVFAGSTAELALRRPSAQAVQRVSSRESELPPLLVLRLATDTETPILRDGFEPR